MNHKFYCALLTMLCFATLSVSGQRKISLGDGNHIYNVRDVKSITCINLPSDLELTLSKTPDYSIFYTALQQTGLLDTLACVEKDREYHLANATSRDGQKLICPEQCLIKFTIFAETDQVFNSLGIKSFDDLAKKCKEWYGTPTWYDYVNEKGITISTGTDYTNEFNVVHMFMAYHIIRGGMPTDRLVYERNDRTRSNWNICFGYEPQEYYETLLPHTLLKVWGTNPMATDINNRKLYLNRYRRNNTLTDEIGTFGSDATHLIIYQGAEIDRSKSLEFVNCYMHKINDVLLYDQTTVNSQNERMRFDVENILPEIADNGFKFATGADINAMGQNGDYSRVAFHPEYFDNLVCYNPNTVLRYCVMGAWRALNSAQFQGWDAFDFAMRLPSVPTGTYEIRVAYPPMNRGGFIQFYLGTSKDLKSMRALGESFDASADPTQDGNPMGCEQIPYSDESGLSDYGVRSDFIMHQRGYMRSPASFSRGTYNTITDKLTYNPSDIYSAARNITGSTSCRSEWGYGTMMLRRVVATVQLRQGEEYWLRLKSMLNDINLGWSMDFIELCPISISNNQEMKEDWY